jgi:oligopeptide transport system substrate-binding protein
VHFSKPWSGVLAVVIACAFVAVSCGGSKDNGSGSTAATTTTTEENAGPTTTLPLVKQSCGTLSNDPAPNGGELVDYAQLADGPNLTSFDPSVVSTIDEAQITSAVWDGLTDFDFTDKCNPVLKADVASNWTSNADATQFTFTIKPGEKFSNGDPVLPSSFQLGWERMGNKKTASNYGYLIDYIKGGSDYAAGKASSVSGIHADDAKMTLTVDMASPNADFPAIVSMQEWSPIDKTEFDKVKYKTGWGKGITIGNGPYMVQKADSTSVVLVPNPNWAGDIYGTTKPHLSKITFMITQDVNSAFQAFQSGEGDTGPIPTGQYGVVQKQYKSTVKSPQLANEYYAFGFDSKQVGGDKNLKLRQAISEAINRDEINQKAFEGVRVPATGITPPGIPGFQAGLCKYCQYNPADAKKLYSEWQQAGGKVNGTIKIQYNSGGGHEQVVQLIQADLKDVLGLDVEPAPSGDNYFTEIAKKGACTICRSGWTADYPTYGNFMVDLFGADAIDGNNLGRFDDPKFESLTQAAQSEPDPTKRGQLYNEAESYLLNDQQAALPIVWNTGDQVYGNKLINYDQMPLGLILWQRVGKAS